MKSIDLVLGLLLATTIWAHASAHGFSKGQQEPDLVWIWKSDGGRICRVDKDQNTVVPVDPKTGKRELEDNGVAVYKMGKGNDKQFHPQVCGGDAGTRNYYSISSKDWGKAEMLEYKKDGTEPISVIDPDEVVVPADSIRPRIPADSIRR